MIPTFNDKEVDNYFLHFEKVAENLKWPKESWTILLQTLLKGKAQDTFSALTVGQSSEYDLVKRTLLKAYDLVSDTDCQKFRSAQKKDNETFEKFAREKETLFDRWCNSRNFGKSRAFNHYQLEGFFQELESKCDELVYYCAVHWPSNEKLLQQQYDFRNVVCTYSEMKGQGELTLCKAKVSAHIDRL
ncbi:Hypothetical predicted protein [Octopus vulgaris]|uniref:SCAN domain-containing protein 3-like n=1 Tax=Octopus vulgaris TaxID=6645 RepID=A0AA36AMY3_OCTVU|nr:Hypothetical predicted protein [Octopus vulgaris]